VTTAWSAGRSVGWVHTGLPNPPPRRRGEVGCSQLGEYKGGGQLPIRPTWRAQWERPTSQKDKTTITRRTNSAGRRGDANFFGGRLGGEGHFPGEVGMPALALQVERARGPKKSSKPTGIKWKAPKEPLPARPSKGEGGTEGRSGAVPGHAAGEGGLDGGPIPLDLRRGAAAPPLPPPLSCQPTHTTHPRGEARKGGQMRSLGSRNPHRRSEAF